MKKKARVGLLLGHDSSDLVRTHDFTHPPVLEPMLWRWIAWLQNRKVLLDSAVCCWPLLLDACPGLQWVKLAYDKLGLL